MTWIMYALGALALGAAVLALYEWRKGRSIGMDDSPDPTRDPVRAAYTDAEKLRAESSIAQPPHGGGIF
ncbi:MAG: hypothetical protein HKP51_04000 [Sulfitobacter sp.]|nr:hypothetical protein [Sulfitobacter sp.]